MKTRSLYALAALGGIAMLALVIPQPLSGQISLKTTPTPKPAATAAKSDDLSPEMTALIAALTAQNKQLADNQVQIDAKIDKLNEIIQQTRIFASRGK